MFLKCFLVLIGIASALAVDVDVAKPISLTVPILSQNHSEIPEVVSNNVTGRSLASSLYHAAVPFVIRQLGLIECAGLDHSFGGDFFQRILGEGADVGGNYLCQPTCGGECVPTQDVGQAPVSIYYPFGCRCAPTRCDANGPIVTDLIRPIFKVVCAPDPRCTCASMAPPGELRGYICNWINLNTHLPVAVLGHPILQGYPPERSPIRWCSCCPPIIH